MSLRLVFCLSIVAILLGAAVTAQADVPQLINYQGVLLDSGGQPVTVSTPVIFGIWDDPTVGDSLWSEQQMVAPDGAGQFSILLGSVSPIPDSAFATADAYLSIKVDTDPEMSPRQRIASAGYSHRVSTVDGAAAGTLSGSLFIEDNPDDPPDVALIVIRGSGGDDEVVASSSSIGLNSTTNGSVNFSTSGNAMTVTDGNGDVRISISFDADTSKVTVFEPSTAARAAGQMATTPKFELSSAGIRIFGESANDVVATITRGGDIYSKGQAIMGQNFAPLSKSGSAPSTFAAWSTVFGFNNTATGDSATVSGGYNNAASGFVSIIGGGANCQASGHWSVVGGGLINQALHSVSTVGGGNQNIASAYASTVAGGQVDTASGDYSFVGGGGYNTASAQYATVSGGTINMASGIYAAVGGGGGDTASGAFSTVTGGRLNTASGDYSSAAGRRAKANHDGTWVWADQTNADFTSTAVDQFLIRAGGGVGIGVNNPSVELHVAGDICYTGTIGACSDARYKTDIETLSGALDKVSEMRGVNFNWKGDEFPEQKFSDQQQVGFIAQELKEIVPEVVLEDDEGYLSVDYGRLTPILVEAIKELDHKTNEIAELKTQMAELQTLVKKLLAAKQ